jgi:hypothetical protein
MDVLTFIDNTVLLLPYYCLAFSAFVSLRSISSMLLCTGVVELLTFLSCEKLRSAFVAQVRRLTVTADWKLFTKRKEVSIEYCQRLLIPLHDDVRVCLLERVGFARLDLKPLTLFSGPRLHSSKFVSLIFLYEVLGSGSFRISFQ